MKKRLVVGGLIGLVIVILLSLIVIKTMVIVNLNTEKITITYYKSLENESIVIDITNTEQIKQIKKSFNNGFFTINETLVKATAANYVVIDFHNGYYIELNANSKLSSDSKNWHINVPEKATNLIYEIIRQYDEE